jgi:deoxyribose-phosphate aldolase
MDQISAIAGMIDHSLLHPTLTDQDLRAGCELANSLGVAAVCVKPYATKQAAEWTEGSKPVVCSVIGFPHGNSSIRVKEFETREACQDGAKEIDMVVNVGKVLGGDWEYVKKEIGSVVFITKGQGAALKVIFENDFLTEDKFKIRLCEICSELEVEFVKTSTGYGFVKGKDGKYAYQGATEHDLILMRSHCSRQVQIKAAGGIRTLDELLWARSLGATRIGASATATIMEEAAGRLGGGRLEISTQPDQVRPGY